MNKIFETIGRIVFYAFVVVVFLWTSSLTLQEVKSILPGDALTPFFALALFDGGAVAWLLAWMGHARGLWQRGIALIMLVIDLLGVVLMAAGRLFTSGSAADAPENIGAIVVWGIIGATLVNLAAVYSFHIADPEVIAAIESGVMVDTLRDEALKQAKANMASEAQALGAIMAARATAEIKYNLRLPMTTTESAQVIEGHAVNLKQPDQVQQPAQETPGIMARWIMTAAQRMKRKAQPAPVMVTNAATVDAAQLVNDEPQQPAQAVEDANPTNAPTP